MSVCIGQTGQHQLYFGSQSKNMKESGLLSVFLTVPVRLLWSRPSVSRRVWQEALCLGVVLCWWRWGGPGSAGSSLKDHWLMWCVCEWVLYVPHSSSLQPVRCAPPPAHPRLEMDTAGVFIAPEHKRALFLKHEWGAAPIHPSRAELCFRVFQTVVHSHFGCETLPEGLVR